MNKGLLIGIMTFIMGLGSIQAQIFTGGTFGVHFDNDGYYVDAAPIIGYRYYLLQVGVSPFLSYKELHNQAGKVDFGGRVFSQLTIIQDVFAHAEFQMINTELPGASRQRKWIMSLPIGGGYRYKISDKATAHGMILYDVLMDPNSPAKNPIVRGGITYSF